MSSAPYGSSSNCSSPRWRWPNAASYRPSFCSAAPAFPTRPAAHAPGRRATCPATTTRRANSRGSITLKSLESDCTENVICTGGGPGVMEAGNRGAADAGGCSISLNIVLPHEQVPNLYGTPDLSFNFHYFGIRKMHFLMRAKTVAVFPGGFGTFDELFETLTLIQTKRMAPMPILLFGRDFWEKVINWDALAEAGTISPGDVRALPLRRERGGSRRGDGDLGNLSPPAQTAPSGFTTRR